MKTEKENKRVKEGRSRKRRNKKITNGEENKGIRKKNKKSKQIKREKQKQQPQPNFTPQNIQKHTKRHESIPKASRHEKILCHPDRERRRCRRRFV